MALDGLSRTLLDELMYERGFPPRAVAMRIKEEFNARGAGQSSMVAQQVAGAYVTVARTVLDDFADQALKSGTAIGLVSSGDVRAAILEAHKEVFDLARGLVLDELPGDYGRLGAAQVDAQRGTVWEHLDRKIKLQALKVASPSPTKEVDQKFQILLSVAQSKRDFAILTEVARSLGNPVTCVFLDIDHFKSLNTRFTNAKVDQTILPEVQRLLVKLVHGRGEAYLHGGDEFVLMVPNLDEDEGRVFAEKVRRSVEGHKFVVDEQVVGLTISIGVAMWPVHGSSYEAILEAANRAQIEAKATRNTVVLAGAAVIRKPVSAGE